MKWVKLGCQVTHVFVMERGRLVNVAQNDWQECHMNNARILHHGSIHHH